MLQKTIFIYIQIGVYTTELKFTKIILDSFFILINDI